MPMKGSWPRDHEDYLVGACPQNLAITAMRLTGATNIAASTRHHSRRPDRPLQMVKNV